MNKKELNKKGLSGKTWFIILGLIILVLLIFFIYKHNTCQITQDEIDKSTNPSLNPLTNMYNAFSVWFKQNVLLCQQERVGWLDKTTGFLKDKLGFNETLYDFFYPGLVVGLITGFLIYLVYLLAEITLVFSLNRWLFQKIKGPAGGAGASISRNAELAQLRSSWLGFIGGNLWKVIPVAVFYAVIMQIPLLNSFFDIVTFKWLFKEAVWNSIFLRSIILAFYLGLLPGAFESFMRYRLRMRYYKNMVAFKYGAKEIRATAGK